jgi:hypothetical protein
VDVDLICDSFGIGITPAKDTTAAWDKQQPYNQADVEALLDYASDVDRVLVIL